MRKLAFIEVPSLTYELGVLHLLQVANQPCLGSCPLPGADAGPVSSCTYMIRGLGVGIWLGTMEQESMVVVTQQVVIGGVIGASGVKLDATC